MPEVNKPAPTISPSMAPFYEAAKQGRLLVQKCHDYGLLRFAAEVPYAVIVVKLEEGPKLVSNLVGVKPHEIKCGMPVEVVFEKLNDQVTLPKFRPRASQ